MCTLYLKLAVFCSERVDDCSDLREGSFVTRQLLVPLIQEREVVLKVRLELRELLSFFQQLITNPWTGHGTKLNVYTHICIH